MNSFISILNNSQRTFDYLNDKFEDELNKIANWLFFLYGVTNSYYVEYPPDILISSDNQIISILLYILISILGGTITILFFKLVITNIVFGIGKILNGRAEWIDIQTVVAYCLVPLSIGNLIILALNKTDLGLNRITLISDGILLIISIKIVLKGLMRFNQYGLGKSIINGLPLFILFFTPYVVFLLFQLKN